MSQLKPISIAYNFNAGNVIAKVVF